MHKCLCCSRIMCSLRRFRAQLPSPSLLFTQPHVYLACDHVKGISLPSTWCRNCRTIFVSYICTTYFPPRKRVRVVETLTPPPGGHGRLSTNSCGCCHRCAHHFLPPPGNAERAYLRFVQRSLPPTLTPLFGGKIRFPDDCHVVATTRVTPCCHLFRIHRHVADPVGVPQEGNHGAVVL